MARHRLRRDLSHLVSWVLLASAAATIATGIVADAWDLNGFRIHTIAGYAMTVAALAHVALSWHRLVAYARVRFRRRPRRPATARTAAPSGVDARPIPAPSAAAPPASAPSAGARPASARRGIVGAILTRRRMLGVAAAGAAGFVAGRGLRPPPVIPQGSDLGVVYHEWSKPGVIDALGTLANWGGKPPLYKRYDHGATIPLPDRPLTSDVSLPEAIQRRHSTREYGPSPLSIDELAALVRHIDGLRAGSSERRTAPSSGALYPIEVYAVVNNVEGLDPGVYHYDVRGHGLSQVRAGDVAGDVMGFGLGQDFLAAANVVFVLTMIHQRMRFKYRDRSYRYGLLEAGHLGQNLYLTATAMGLGACAVGAFDDDGINALLDVDGREEVAVYLLAAGNLAA